MSQHAAPDAAIRHRVRSASSAAPKASVNVAVDTRSRSAVVTKPPPTTRLRLGRLIPLTVVAWLILDLGLRFAPLSWLHIYPFQIAARYPGRYAPFMPDQSLHTPHYPGELALMANLKPTELRPPVAFTTDSLGFRQNGHVNRSDKFDMLVMEGDSFTFGAALSDDETFPAMLSKVLGSNIYNGGRMFSDPERLKELDWLLAKLGDARPNTIVYVLLESTDFSLSKGYDQKKADRIGRALLGESAYTDIKDELRYLNRWYQLWMPVSPLKIVSSRFHKWLCDDRVLPNVYKEAMVERRLPDGRRFLIDPRYVERYLHPPSDEVATKTADYIAWLRDRMQERRLGFRVLLLPESATVYGPWLLGASNVAPGTVPYLDRLERQLHSRRISVVNGLTVLRGSAASEVASGELSYYREDHHWNPQGVRKLSEAMADVIRNTSPATVQAKNVSKSIHALQ